MDFGEKFQQTHPPSLDVVNTETLDKINEIKTMKNRRVMNNLLLKLMDILHNPILCLDLEFSKSYIINEKKKRLKSLN